MNYAVNLILAIALSYFTFGIYDLLEVKLYTGLLVFAFWYAILWGLSYFYDKEHFIKLPRFFGLGIFYFKELVISSFQVAYASLTSTSNMSPGVIALPLDAETDLEIALLANLITLTPGTLSIEVSDDRSILYVHTMFIEDGDIEKMEKVLKEDFEKRILRITR